MLRNVLDSLVAAGTLSLAGVTAWLAFKTRDLARSAARQAQAASEEAEATNQLANEARRDRELIWRPILSVEVGSPTVGEHTYDEGDVRISNVGTGPALNCAYASWTPDGASSGFTPRHCFVRGFDLGNAGSPITWSLFVPPPGSNDRLRRVLVCSDIFGNRYRFGSGEIEISPRGNENPPEWAITWL